MAWRELPKGHRNGPQRQPMDKIDQEAEAQGRATRTARDFAPANLGKRISKEHRQHDGARTAAETKATRYLVIKTNDVYKTLTS